MFFFVFVVQLFFFFFLVFVFYFLVFFFLGMGGGGATGPGDKSCRKRGVLTPLNDLPPGPMNRSQFMVKCTVQVIGGSICKGASEMPQMGV